MQIGSFGNSGLSLEKETFIEEEINYIRNNFHIIDIKIPFKFRYLQLDSKMVFELICLSMSRESIYLSAIYPEKTLN